MRSDEDNEIVDQRGRSRSSFKATYERILNSPQFKRDSYARKLRGLLVLAFLGPMLLLAYLAETLLHLSGYVTCTIVGIVGISLAVFISEDRANKKFKRK